MTLNLPNLSRLTNDPVAHDPAWPAIPTKLPSNIPKFEGKPSEDPSEHVTMFHLWCSLNSLHQDSICLSLFQCTLIGPATCLCQKLFLRLGEQANTISREKTQFKLGFRFCLCVCGCKLQEHAGNTFSK